MYKYICKEKYIICQSLKYMFRLRKKEIITFVSLLNRHNAIFSFILFLLISFSIVLVKLSCPKLQLLQMVCTETKNLISRLYTYINIYAFMKNLPYKNFIEVIITLIDMHIILNA